MTLAPLLAPSSQIRAGSAQHYRATAVDSAALLDVQAWRLASGGSRALFVESRFLRIVESAFEGQASFRYLLIRDAEGVPKACATLCILRIDITTMGGPRLKRWIDTVRRFAPGFAYARVGMCGLPVSLGESGIGHTADCDMQAVIPLVHDALVQLCAEHGVGIMLFKEHEEQEASKLSWLCREGYVRAESPAMHVFDATYDSFESYFAALRSQRRNDIRRSQRKFANANMTIERLRGAAVAEVYTDQLHAMYLAVVAKAQNKLEVLPAAFFRELPSAFGDAVSLTLVRKAGAPVAFNYGIATGERYYFLFCGMNYAELTEGDAYFNMLFRDLEHGLGEHVQTIRLGQSSESFKARVGCRAVPLYFFIRGRGLFWSSLLSLTARQLFPPQLPALTYKVFKA